MAINSAPPDGDAPIPLKDLPLFWEGRARTFRIIDAARLQSNKVTLYQAGCYDECAKELRAALATSPARDAAEGEATKADAIHEEGFIEGVNHTVEVFAKLLKPLDVWNHADGSEDHDTDLANTFLNILAAKGLYDPETAKFTAPPKPAPDAVREARLVIEAARNEIVLTIAYLGRDGGTERAPATIKALIDRLAKTDAKLRTYLAAPVPPADGAVADEQIANALGNAFAGLDDDQRTHNDYVLAGIQVIRKLLSAPATEPPQRELHGSSMPPDRIGAAELCRCDQEGHAITPPVSGDREATPSSDGAGEKMSFDELTHISERMDYIEAHADEGGTGSPANLQEMVGYIRRLVSFADRVLQGFGDVTPLGGQEAIADIAGELESLAGDVHENSPTTAELIDAQVDRLRSLSLPVQLGAGEQSSDAEEADRYFDMAGDFGNRIQRAVTLINDYDRHGSVDHAVSFELKKILDPEKALFRQPPQSSGGGR